MPGGYKYALVLLGLTLGGDFFLVPFVYSTRLGLFSLWELFGLVLISELISDVVWYSVGRLIKEERVYKLPFIRHKPHVIERARSFLKSRDSQILLASKFVYGTRIVTQILCGTHKMKLVPYFAINLGGMAVWSAFLLGLVSVIDLTVGSLGDVAKKIQITLAVFVVVVVCFSLILNKVVAKRMLRE